MHGTSSVSCLLYKVQTSRDLQAGLKKFGPTCSSRVANMTSDPIGNTVRVNLQNPSALFNDIFITSL